MFNDDNVRLAFGLYTDRAAGSTREANYNQFKCKNRTRNQGSGRQGS